MAMGRRRKQRQGQIWVEAKALAKGPSHPFYQRLNEVLERHGFDNFVEGLAAKFYAPHMGRPSLPPPVYFRLLLIGYFEGIDSERGIAWRVADSLTLREFLGLALTESPPDHSTISRNRRLLELEAHQEAFTWVLGVLAKEGVLRGKTLEIDATTLARNTREVELLDSGHAWACFRAEGEKVGMEAKRTSPYLAPLQTAFEPCQTLSRKPGEESLRFGLQREPERTVGGGRSGGVIFRQTARAILATIAYAFRAEGEKAGC